MKPLPDAAYTLQLIFLYLGINMVYSHSQKADNDPAYNEPQAQPQHQEHGDGMANFEQQQNLQVDYTYDDQKEEFFCYSCVYHVRQGNAAGHQNCRDPFITIDIPKVPCNGACAKIYHKVSDTEYTITRTCLPNCKDMQDHEGYTQCCTGSLCNGRATSNGVSCIVVTTGVAASTWYIFR